MLKIDHLNKRRGSAEILSDVSFEARPGRVTGFLGPNGAGKSSTLRILLGLDHPTSGTALVNGVPFTEVTLEVMDPIRGTTGKTHTFRQFGLEKPRTMPDGRVYLGGRPQGWPTWREGEVALVFLYPKARLTGLQTTVGLGYGKLSLGNGRALNAYDNASLFSNVKVNRSLLSASERSMFDTKKGAVDARTLSRFLHRAVEGKWVQKGSIANAKR